MNQALLQEGLLAALQQIGESTGDGFILYDFQSHRIIHYNSAADQLLGPLIPVAGVKNEPWLDRVSDEDKENVRNQYQLILTNKYSGDIEFRLSTQNNTADVFVRCAHYPIFSMNLLLILIKEITREREQQQFLVEFTTKKNTILETTTHNLSGALLLMKHLTDQAQKELIVTTDNLPKEYLGLLRDNAQYCLELIDNVLKEENIKAPLIPVRPTGYEHHRESEFYL